MSFVSLSLHIHLYEHGTGIAQDEAKAVEWYTVAANQGDEDAILMLRLLARGC
jgi:TPR repeat protein